MSVRDRTRIGLVVTTEAEFWLPLSALVTYFAGAIVARLPKTGIFGPWNLADFQGIWRSDNSGGSLKFRNSFLRNPQVLHFTSFFSICISGDFRSGLALKNGNSFEIGCEKFCLA